MVHLTTGSEKSEGKLQCWQAAIDIVAMEFVASNKVDTFRPEFLITIMVFCVDVITSIQKIIDAILQFLRYTEES